MSFRRRRNHTRESTQIIDISLQSCLCDFSSVEMTRLCLAKMNLHHLYGSKKNATKHKKSMTFKSCFSGFIIFGLLYYRISSKVVPCLMSPVLKPFLNQYILCSDDPWVKESGTTCPLILL